MDSTDQFAGLMGTLLKSTPDSYPLQRLTAAAADNARTKRIRTQQLKALAAVDDLAPDLREALLRDRNDRVQAAVWARGDTTLDGMDVSALPALCLLTVLGRADVPSHVASEIVKRLDGADTVRVVLGNEALPADLVAAVYRSLCDPFAAAPANTDPTKYLRPLNDPDMAQLVADDPQAPLRARIYAAARVRPDHTVEAVDNILDSLRVLDPDDRQLQLNVPDARAWQSVRFEKLFQPTGRQWVTHAHGLDKAVELAHRVGELSAFHAREVLAALRTSSKQLRNPTRESVDKLLRPGGTNVTLLLDSAPDEAARVRVASRVAVSPFCRDEHFDLVAPVLPDASPDGISALRRKFRVSGPPGQGLARFPDLWVESLRRPTTDYKHVRYLPQTPAFDAVLSAIVENYVARPEDFPPQLGLALLAGGRVSGQQLVRFPTDDLVAAAASAKTLPEVSSAFAGALAQLAQDTPGANGAIATALALLLGGGGALDDLLGAVTAAYGPVAS